MKSTGLIFQDFSIAGILKQWEKQQFDSLDKPCLRGAGDCGIINTACENCYDNYHRWVTANRPEFAGAKTETRRTRGLNKINENPNDWELCSNIVDNEGKDVNPLPMPYGDIWQFANVGAFKVFSMNIKCPFGKAGDEIWVKETYGYEYNASNGQILYKQKVTPTSFQERATKWKSPMFMPKAASRILLEITDIKIERLQDITEEGALREGAFKYDDCYAIGDIVEGTSYCTPESAVNLYKYVWKELHGQESWDKNPWVWVITFKMKEVKP